MQKRSSKKKEDMNQTAARVAQQTIGADTQPPKNPAAVALGRLGGLKGGAARAKSLSKEKRSEIAQKAAQSRWKKRN